MRMAHVLGVMRAEHGERLGILGNITVSSVVYVRCVSKTYSRTIITRLRCTNR